MTPDIASIVITGVVIIGAALNTWISLRIRADVSDLKVWTFEKFVTRTDCDDKMYSRRHNENNA
jgi:hypothetical protein